MDELEHRVFHDAFRETLDRGGCHYGQLHKQGTDSFEKKYESKMESFQVWQTVVRDKTLPRIAGKSEDAFNMAETTIDNQTQLKGQFDSIWWKLLLTNIGGGGVAAGILILVMKLTGLI